MIRQRRAQVHKPVSRRADGTHFRLLHRLVGYGLTRSVVEGFLGARGIAIASILGPEFYGVWSLFRLALQYLGFIGQTLIRGMEVVVSKAGPRGRQLVSRSQHVWGQIVLFPMVWFHGLLATAVALTWLWPKDNLADLAILGIALVLVPERLWRYTLSFLRASGMLRLFAVLELLYAALQLAFTITFAYFWGLGGALAGYFAATSISLGVAAHFAPWRPRWSPRRFKHVFRIGFPVSFNNLLGTLLRTIDQLLVGIFFGIATLGIYAFGVSLSTFGVYLAMILRNVILTDVYTRKADKTLLGAGRSTIDRSLAAFTTLLPPFAGIAALSAPAIILALLPKYEEAILLAQIFVFIGVLQGIINVSIMGIVAEGRQGQLPLVCLGAAILNVSLSLGALSIGLGLVGVAAAAFVSRLSYSIAVLWMLAATRPRVLLFRSLLKSLTPTIYCTVMIVLIHLGVPVQDWKSLVISVPVYLLGLLPLAAVYRLTITEFGIRRSEN